MTPLLLLLAATACLAQQPTAEDMPQEMVWVDRAGKVLGRVGAVQNADSPRSRSPFSSQTDHDSPGKPISDLPRIRSRFSRETDQRSPPRPTVIDRGES